MKVKYQITMEVEVEVDNLNDKDTSRATSDDLLSRAKMAMSIFEVNKIQVSRIGATGVTPRACRRKLHQG